ncbi:MAG: DUF1178 family protein [Burkholderiaceae bacterium]|nr:DUF1178 family protein [Burkholderiaceae bacterium]
MSLKVFDLYCDQGHVFEGWFGSADNYDTQREQGLISCPVCASHVIGKKLSAPRLNVSHLRNLSVDPAAQQQTSVAASGPSTQTSVAQLQAAVFRHFRELVSKTENVGPQFTNLARSMHEGDTPARPIRGTATEDERQELVEEGIAVMPIPEFLDDDRLQ